jgi:hypothetical protein
LDVVTVDTGSLLHGIVLKHLVSWRLSHTD